MKIEIDFPNSLIERVSKGETITEKIVYEAIQKATPQKPKLPEKMKDRTLIQDHVKAHDEIVECFNQIIDVLHSWQKPEII